jgi:HTH-type transcriptional regulator, competence development regulator
MSEEFGKRIRERRLALSHKRPQYSLRRVASEVEVSFSFLSKVERGDLPPPSEETIKKLAAVLGDNPDVLLALAGKVSSDLKEAIIKRPELFAQLIRQVKDAPEQAVLRIVREVRDGKW